jgi:hypothetical protein
MSADWINTIGAKYLIDPEYFCRHLKFRSVDDVSNTYSIPPLPSASWHLIQLPVMTACARDAFRTSTQTEALLRIREKGAKSLAAHQREIRNLLQSQLDVGKSMVREFHVLDETHYVLEQRISICMKEGNNGTFTSMTHLEAKRGSHELIKRP